MSSTGNTTQYKGSKQHTMNIDNIKITEWTSNTIKEMIENEGMINAEAILADLIDQGVVDEEYVDIISPAPNFDYDEAADLKVQDVLLEEIAKQLRLFQGSRI